MGQGVVPKWDRLRLVYIIYIQSILQSILQREEKRTHI